MNLIGIVGQKRSGKDTAAAALASAGYERIKFAQPLKDMLRTLCNSAGIEKPVTENLIEGNGKELPIGLFGGKSMRFLMQTIGTEWGRDMISKSIWVDVALNNARGFRRAVISDCRFENEAAAIKAAGGKLIKIVREGCGGDGHPSEILMELIKCDLTISNDSTIDELQRKVLQLIK